MDDYPIIKIEGVGEKYAKKLAGAGISTTLDLLRRARTPRDRRELADMTGISGKLILEWANLADLMRIRGVGEEWSDFLEEAGVDTVPELARRDPDKLFMALQEFDTSTSKIVRRKPSRDQIASWIAQARDLGRTLHYTDVDDEAFAEAQTVMSRFDPALVAMALRQLHSDARRAQLEGVDTIQQGLKEIYDSLPEDVNRLQLMAIALIQLRRDVRKAEIDEVKRALEGLDGQALVAAASDFAAGGGGHLAGGCSIEDQPCWPFTDTAPFMPGNAVATTGCSIEDQECWPYTDTAPFMPSNLATTTGCSIEDQECWPFTDTAPFMPGRSRPAAGPMAGPGCEIRDQPCWPFVDIDVLRPGGGVYASGGDESDPPKCGEYLPPYAYGDLGDPNAGPQRRPAARSLSAMDVAAGSIMNLARKYPSFRKRLRSMCDEIEERGEA